jgi:hypothetical protein
VCALEVTMLLVIKVPTISEISAAATNYSTFKDFESSMINIYSDFVSFYFDSAATPDYLTKNTQHVQTDMKSVFVRLLLFNPNLGGPFLNAFQPNFNLTMDYTFLTENYVYFANSMLDRQMAANPITTDEYTFTMNKYKGPLLLMFRIINQSLAVSTAALLSDHNLRFFVYLSIFVAVTCLTFLVLVSLYNLTFQATKKIYETFLYISDAKIYEIGSYLVQSYRFFERQFNIIEDPDKGLFQQPGESVSTDQKKAWKRGKASFVEGVGLINVLNLALFLCFAGIFIGKYFVENSLVTQLHIMYTISQQTYQSEITISSLIMNAKDFLASPASLAGLPDNYLADLQSNLTTSVLLGRDSSSVTQRLAAKYTAYLCNSINLTLYNNSINCSTYQSGLLNNGVDSIKNIMNSNLGFIFAGRTTNSTAVLLKAAYKDLDRNNDLIRHGINNILKEWLVAFKARAAAYNYLMIIFSILLIVLILFKTAVWLVTIRASAGRQHEYARKVFSHLVPSDTLNLNKFIRVQLINSRVMD